jgi:TRAP-type mannitol/chloroaromatic compound transport system permease small subunit
MTCIFPTDPHADTYGQSPGKHPWNRNDLTYVRNTNVNQTPGRAGLGEAIRRTINQMPKLVVYYVKYVDSISTKLGRATMYTIFIMIGVLLLGAITRNILNMPLSWTVEMAQFIITGYYIVGGAYSMQLEDHVRMDLLYDRFSGKTKAKIDVFTNIFLVLYLVALLIGSISSTMYAIEYGERKFSQWNPSMIPIKIIMVAGIFLMLLQAVSTFFKDLAKARGITIS